VEKLVQQGVLVDGRQIKLAAFPRRYGQAFRVPRSSALNVEATLERPKLVRDGAETYLQVGLQAIRREVAKRPPLNVALVIDTSGSMGDEGKLGHVKAAALSMVDRLSASDLLAVVTFEDNARVVVPSQRVGDSAAVRNAVRALAPGASTNAYAGLQAGYSQVNQNASREHLSRVILLSDGQTNTGVTDLPSFQRLATQYADQGVSCTTVGVGLQYNEQLMLAVAESGKGNYHFLKDAAGATEVFRQELNELMTVVAKAVRLRIRLAEGVELLGVLGSPALDAAQTAAAKADERKVDRKVYEDLGIVADRQNLEDEPGIKMLIPQFYQGDSHVVMLRVRVPQGVGQRNVADVEVRYKDLVFAKNRTNRVPVNVTYTRSGDEMIASAKPAVVKNRLGFQTGEALLQAAQLLHRGDVGGAVKALDERMVVLGVAARQWRDKDLDRDGKLLARYRDVVAGARTRYAGSAELGQYLAKSLTYSGYRLGQ
jgi:Ca-activated chloride channel family protein